MAESYQKNMFVSNCNLYFLTFAYKRGFVGGVSLLAASITGPGLVTIPTLFQQAGWLM
jgi:hypothetical protein